MIDEYYKGSIGRRRHTLSGVVMEMDIIMLIGMIKVTHQHLLGIHHLLEDAMVKDTIQIDMIMGVEVITIHQQDLFITDQMKVVGDANIMAMLSCMSYSYALNTS